MQKNLRVLTEMGVAIALAMVLNFLPLWKMPQGGSISLEMLPIFLIAFRWGPGPGLMSGLAYGLLQLAFNPYIIHPVQLIMDYPLPYMLLGLAGLFKERIQASPGWIFTAALVGGAGRLITHILSGVIFFSQYAPEGQNVWMYSTVYNASYLVPSLAINILLLFILNRTLLKT